MNAAPVGPPPVAINGRFLGRPVTGVERYANELLARLPNLLDGDCAILGPRRSVSGVAGHVWEQVVLPTSFRRSQARVLVSLCNLGPVTVRSQLVVVHDVAPFRLPDRFGRAYGTQVRWVQRQLARRCAIATVSERSRREVADVFGIDADAIGLVPPAVGPPFSAEDVGVPLNRAVLVGGHDSRKNASFLLGLWPEVHARTGMELHVVARSGSDTLRRADAGTPPGVRWHWDLDDLDLARLYRSATCVVSPSDYEGFGLPLLEGMACGTPFLATDTGAAAELAVSRDEQLLPLDPAVWAARLEEWAGRDLTRLRTASLERAGRWNWDRSAQALAGEIARVGAGPRSGHAA